MNSWSVDCAMNYNTTKAVFHEVNRYMLEKYTDVNGVDFTKNFTGSFFCDRHGQRCETWKTASGAVFEIFKRSSTKTIRGCCH